jgi:hypothetical protein
MTTTNWDDPAERGRLAERVGTAEYNRLAGVHFKATTVAVVNGYSIRPVQTRFGRLFSIGGAGKAYSSLSQATAEAWKLPEAAR